MKEALEGKQYLIFKVSGRLFAVSIGNIERIIPVDFVYKVPLSKPYFDGLVGMDKRAIPVFNVGDALGLKAVPEVGDSFLAVEHLQGADIGLLIPEVVAVARIASREILDCESPYPGVGQKVLWNGNEVNILLAEQLVFGLECD
ncbi:MAG: chemotaxis protein CheW [bacterium]|nr:chemotaxis protein CheW [bacterium]